MTVQPLTRRGTQHNHDCSGAGRDARVCVLPGGPRGTVGSSGETTIRRSKMEWNGMEWNDSQSIISDSERQNKWGTLCESMLVLVYFVLYTKASLALSLDHCFFMNDARYYGLRRGASLAPRVLFCMYCL
jgi:hypothetical protein